MELTAMRFKDYTWPHNPESCRCVWERKLLRRKLPVGGVSLQDLGRWGRTFEGEGGFFGAGAEEAGPAAAGAPPGAAAAAAPEPARPGRSRSTTRCGRGIPFGPSPRGGGWRSRT